MKSVLNDSIHIDNSIEDNPKLISNSEQEDTENSAIFQDLKNSLNNTSSNGSALKLSTNKLNSINSKELLKARSTISENISFTKASNKKPPKKETIKHNCRSPVQSFAAGTSYQKHSRLAPQFSNKNISSDFQASNEHFLVNDDKSNLFLYIDFHGHASKKGVFMYGNHLPNTYEAVECMLLPRLMSMNSHHFHFDACNFSERNMYLKYVE